MDGKIMGFIPLRFTLRRKKLIILRLWSCTWSYVIEESVKEDNVIRLDRNHARIARWMSAFLIRKFLSHQKIANVNRK